MKVNKYVLLLAIVVVTTMVLASTSEIRSWAARGFGLPGFSGEVHLVHAEHR